MKRVREAHWGFAGCQRDCPFVGSGACVGKGVGWGLIPGIVKLNSFVFSPEEHARGRVLCANRGAGCLPREFDWEP